jgi:hypothetical protein
MVPRRKWALSGGIIMPITPKAGDHIVVTLDGKSCNVERIDASGQRVGVRTPLPIGVGYEVARVGAAKDGGRVLVAHHLTPDVLRPWKSSKDF